MAKEKKSKKEHKTSNTKPPTIKGMFVNSHINALKKAKGEKSLTLLEEKCGFHPQFGALEDVPVRLEIEIIEHVLDILTNDSLPKNQRAFEAGRLHFNNFQNTVYGRLILNFLSKDFKSAMLNSPNIAIYVFKHIEFSVFDRGEKSVMLRMENNDYNIDHFRGFFFEWLKDWGYDAEVEGIDYGNGTYEYVMKWK
ncbi:MAG: DUF2378 family protein [Crocinitomicaceae bacterium]|nr:DUF2378 family protein [Crocinitomicaceae bacterium]